MKNKKIGLIGILAIGLVTSCKMQQAGDLVKLNFDFASEQLTYALQEIESAKANVRDSLSKAGKPLVSPRTLDENGN